MSKCRLLTAVLIAALGVVAFVQPAVAESIELSLRSQAETEQGSGRFHQTLTTEAWDLSKTAVIVCDVWDSHHSINAVRRVQEFAPRLNNLLAKARDQGATIIHSPSDCMPAYTNHPARLRAIAIEAPRNVPREMHAWCSLIPNEEKAVYPIDQSDGGEDDDPVEHAAWVQTLKKQGRKPGTPWLAQIDLIKIDPKHDYITDNGVEVWSVLERHGIKNVILTGVHTNMCVLGRPFGLRQMARVGKRVALVRDMTDTMYNPKRWPFVSHFTGTDLIISHVERYVCPTITSDQILGGKPFRFKNDTRPHLVMMIGEREYETKVTLPKFAADHLGRHFKVSLVYASNADRNDFPGLSVLDDADALLISVRRRTLPKDQLDTVRRFIASGKPVLGIRTSSHPFHHRNKRAEAGLADWPEFDAQVFGGNYTGHYGNSMVSQVHFVGPKNHPILNGMDRTTFRQGGSLYKTAPTARGTTVLLNGTVEGQSPEPLAWTFQRKDGGRSFYTSLGHRNDFANPAFIQLLVNGLHWATNLPTTIVTMPDKTSQFRKQWTLIHLPQSLDKATAGTLKNHNGPVWYRCSVRLMQDWMGTNQVHAVGIPDHAQAWFNGHALKLDNGRSVIRAEWIDVDDANLLSVRVPQSNSDRGLKAVPTIQAGKNRLTLQGRWQFRIDDDPKWSNIPLPARYGTSSDIVFQP